MRAVTGATKKSIPITQGAKPANIVEVLAGAVWGQVAQRVSAETSWPSRTDGMVKLAESFLADHHGSGSAGERFQVMVHLEQDVLEADGPWSGSLEDGTRVSAETPRPDAARPRLRLSGVHPREPIGNAVAWLRNWAEENDLHLGPEANMPRWDGTSPDYELAVSGLLSGG